MHRRRLLAGMGAGLAAGLAGCGDETDGDGSETDAGDADEGSSDSGPPFPDAAWLDEDGLDVESVAGLHADALVEAGGFTLFSTATTTHEGEADPDNWLPSQEYESRYDLAGERQYLRQALTGDDEREVSEAYVDGTEAFFREQVGDRVGYDSQTVDRTAEDLENVMRQEAVVGIRVPRGDSDSGEVTYEGLNLWNLAADGEGEVRGERTARFVADAFEGDRNVPAEVTSASATAHVYEAGVVPRIEQTWAGTHEERDARVDVDIDYRDLGAELTEPEWVDEAREATADDE